MAHLYRHAMMNSLSRYYFTLRRRVRKHGVLFWSTDGTDGCGCDLRRWGPGHKTGTYQFFIAVTNSAALGMATWLFLAATGVAQADLGRSLIAALLVAALAFNIFNAYSRLTMRLLILRLNVRVDIERDLPYVAGKQ